MVLSNSLFGYNKFQVDTLIKSKDDEISALKQEVATMRVQLDEFLKMESALKEGIVDARMTGNRIIEESNEEAQKLLSDTKEQIVQYKEELAHQSHDLIDSGKTVQELMQQMKVEMQEILINYQKMISEIDFEIYYPQEQVNQFSSQLEDFEQSRVTPSETLKTRVWENTSISEEEKKELEKLIHEVIANEKQQAVFNEKEDFSTETNRVVKLVKR